MAYRLFVPEHPEQAIAEGTHRLLGDVPADDRRPRSPQQDRRGPAGGHHPLHGLQPLPGAALPRQPLTCMVRPSLGHEEDPEWQITPAREEAKVVVVGAGLAGMQGAAIAAESGHDVIVVRAATRVRRAAPHASRGAAGRRGVHASRELPRDADARRRASPSGAGSTPRRRSSRPTKPDAVVLAAGARTAPPDIPGSTTTVIVTVRELMRGEVSAGKRVVILGGRGTASPSRQFLLAKGGHEITMVESAKKVGRDVNPSYVWRYVKKLKEGNVQILAREQAGGDHGSRRRDRRARRGRRPSSRRDTIVLAMVEPENALEKALKGVCDEVHVIGDAAAVRRAHNATMDGYRIGLEI